ncbi:MAG: MOSC domain-containing protein [Candidatus Kapabacteria bacterium]|nr:MOSC domain-containing protein [Candidatus Kapabacteria bacterium]
MIRITSLHIYPVKSMAGIALGQAELDEFGLCYDRAWMLTDMQGVFITQREFPVLARFRPAIDGGGLRIATPQGDTVTVPLEYDAERRRQVRVWSSEVDAHDEGDGVARVLSDAIGTPCRLVRMVRDFGRRVNPQRAVNDDRVHFGDGYPLHLMSMASLNELNSRLESPAPVNRFRANIIVAGSEKTLEPYEEDTWLTCSIGGMMFDCVKKTSRCVITTIDQETAAQGKEPLRTLARYRTEANNVNMGVYLIHRQKHGRLSAGDTLEVLTRQPAL